MDDISTGDDEVDLEFRRRIDQLRKCEWKTLLKRFNAELVRLRARPLLPEAFNRSFKPERCGEKATVRVVHIRALAVALGVTPGDLLDPTRELDAGRVGRFIDREFWLAV